MKLSIPRYSLEPVLDHAADVWDWWLSELHELVPSPARRLFTSASAVLVMSFEPDGMTLGLGTAGRYATRGRVGSAEVDGPAPRQLTAILAERRPDCVELRLPAVQVLHCHMLLPLTSRRRIAPLLRFELDRQTPFKPAQVYFAARILERDPTAKRMVVDLVLVKRSVADRMLDCARRWGLGPDRMGIEGEEGWEFDFRPEQGPERLSFMRHGLSGALAAVTVILAAAAGYVHVQARADYADALAAELLRSRSAAEATRAIEKQLNGTEARLAFLARRRKAVDAAMVLEELAAKLPDDSWVSDFELAARTFKAQGFGEGRCVAGPPRPVQVVD